MKSMYRTGVVTAVLSLVLSGSGVESRSTGAGSCVGGKAAVGGFHLDYGPRSNRTDRTGASTSLEEARINFIVSGTYLDPNTTEAFDSFAPLIWELESPQIPYRGILVRVEASEDNFFTNVGGDENRLQNDVCNATNGNVVGVTHRDATDKSSSNGTMLFSGEGLVKIDVTIVFKNDDNYSIYAYSNYTIEIAPGGGSNDKPSAAPSIRLPPNTTEPSGSPTIAPIVPSVPVAPAPIYSPALPPKKEPEGKGMSMDMCLDGKGGMMGKSEKNEGKGGKMMSKGDESSKKGGMMMGKGDEKEGKGGMMMGKGDNEEGKGGMMMGKGYYDECDYASDAPSDSPSAAPTASPSDYPSLAPTSTPPSSKKGKGGMMNAGKGGDGGMMGKGMGMLRLLR